MAKAILNSREIFGNVHLGSGGGASFDTLASGEKVSTTTPSGSYKTVTISDISSYDLVLIKLYDTVSDVDYIDYIAVHPSTISEGSYRDYVARLHSGAGNVNIRVTSTSISCQSYSGAWQDIYIDVIATNKDIFV